LPQLRDLMEVGKTIRKLDISWKEEMTEAEEMFIRLLQVFEGKIHRRV
jgi:hypothetical protein